MERQLAALILAAGLGKRMKSDRPKVLHPVCGKPMIDYVLASVQDVGVSRVLAIIGHKGEIVEAHLGNRATCLLQAERLGTGHAVLQAREALRDFDGDVLIVCGDTPLVRAETLRDLVAQRRNLGGAGVVLATRLEDPSGYGRMICDGERRALRIVEQKDASPEEAQVKEVNSGIYCVDAKHLFAALEHVGNDNAQGEYYLTDIVQILHKQDQPIHAVIGGDPTELIGVNSRQDLATADRILRLRWLDEYMGEGVTIVDPATTFIAPNCTFGRDVVIHPFTRIHETCAFGDACEIGPGSEIISSQIGSGAKVRQSWCEETTVEDNAVVGPYARLVPAS